MIEAQPITTVMADCVGALGAGILLGFFYHILRFITGDSRVATPIRDILFAPLAAVLCYSYAVTYSFAGLLRFYILFFIAVGLIVYRQVILKPSHMKERALKQQLVALALLTKKYILYIGGIFKKYTIVFYGKTKNSHFLQKKQLRKRRKVLYNTDINNHFSKGADAKNSKLPKKKKKHEPSAKVGRLLSCGLPSIHVDTNSDTD